MADLSRDELVEMVTRLMNPRPGDKDADHEHLAQQIVDSVPDPDVINYIFHDSTPRTPEEIVDKALAYKPIAL